jgi:hypothetical protein
VRGARISRLLAMVDLIDETGRVYFVDAAGVVTPVSADRYLAMETRDIPLGTLVLATERAAERASLRLRKIDVREKPFRN